MEEKLEEEIIEENKIVISKLPKIQNFFKEIDKCFEELESTSNNLEKWLTESKTKVEINKPLFTKVKEAIEKSKKAQKLIAMEKEFDQRIYKVKKKKKKKKIFFIHFQLK